MQKNIYRENFSGAPLQTAKKKKKKKKKNQGPSLKACKLNF